MAEFGKALPHRSLRQELRHEQRHSVGFRWDRLTGLDKRDISHAAVVAIFALMRIVTAGCGNLVDDA